MKTLREVNIKNRPNYFFNSMTNIKNFDANLLGINQIAFTSTDSVFNNVDAYFEKNKYLVFTLINKNKEALENYTEL